MTARYTPRDPHFAVICSDCRFGRHDCVGSVVIGGSKFIEAGTYQCGCTWCGVRR